MYSFGYKAWGLRGSKLHGRVRPEFCLFVFSFYRPFRPNFWKIEKKRDFFNFIFVFPSDSCQYSTEVQLCFFVLSFLLQTG